MDKKLVAVLGIMTLGIGGLSAVALQSHAAQVIVSPTPTTSSVPNTAVVDKTDTDTETADDATTTMSQKNDTQEQGDNTGADIAGGSEVEDGN